VQEAFVVFEAHAAQETAYITPLLRTAAPQLAIDSDAEHREQELRLRDLRLALARADAAGPAARGMGHAFVVALSRFEGELLVHMADEEERLMPALSARFDDLTLRQVHEALIESIPAAEKRQLLAWMLPALSAPEQAELLGGIRATAPPEAFAALSMLARQVLGPAEWDRLEQALATAA
jgi:hypothetical protein